MLTPLMTSLAVDALVIASRGGALTTIPAPTLPPTTRADPPCSISCAVNCVARFGKLDRVVER